MTLSIRGFGLDPYSLPPSPAIRPWANPAWTGDEAGMDERGAFAGGKIGIGSNGIGVAAAGSWPGPAEFENYVEHGEIRCHPLESYGIGERFQFKAGLKPGLRPAIRGMKIGGVAVCAGHDADSRRTRLRSRRRPLPLRFCFPGGTMTPSLERARYHRGVF